ncbi:MAG: ATP-binding protein [Ferruginibacter sp.]
MHLKNIKDLLLAESEKLNKENKLLQKQLREAKESIEAIKTGSIDALVVANNKDLTIYTEKTADKLYRILIEKMHEGAVTLNEEGTILYCNTHFAKMVSLPLQNVIGTKFNNYIDDFLKKHVEDLVKQDGENTLKEEGYLHTTDGNTLPVLISVNTFSLDNNFVIGIILTDLTIQNKNQEELRNRTRQLEQKNIELENVNKDLTTFTYVSSHDLQEPVRKIQNFVDCILHDEEKNLSETGKEYFRRMSHTAKRMQELIEDLLTYSRTRNSDRKFEKTDLNIIINGVEKDFEEIIQEKKAIIEVADLSEVTVIRFQFHQLFLNLISNSLKFSKAGTIPRIKIRSEIVKLNLLNNDQLHSKTDYCHITYTDNGIGFDPQYSVRIFEVFQHLHGQDEYKGTGMGLAICKRVIENHNGIITATGKLNNGARFDIYIPAL